MSCICEKFYINRNNKVEEWYITHPYCSEHGWLYPSEDTDNKKSLEEYLQEYYAGESGH